MLNTRSPGTQATRMLQEQNRKEARNTRMVCNEVAAGAPRAHYTPSPPRASKPQQQDARPAARLLPNMLTSRATSESSSEPYTSPSPNRLPVLPHSPSRPASVVSPSRRTFHLSPNDRRAFYQQFVDRPGDATTGVARKWQ